jgi:hypothetical protein
VLELDPVSRCGSSILARWAAQFAS